MVKEQEKVSREIKENLGQLAEGTHYIFIIKQLSYYVCIVAQGWKENVHSWNLS